MRQRSQPRGWPTNVTDFSFGRSSVMYVDADLDAVGTAPEPAIVAET
jgi:hypothetical protein